MVLDDCQIIPANNQLFFQQLFLQLCIIEQSLQMLVLLLDFIQLEKVRPRIGHLNLENADLEPVKGLELEILLVESIN